jgi:hypothetical protein
MMYSIHEFLYVVNSTYMRLLTGKGYLCYAML